MASSTGAPGMVPLVYKGKQQPTVWDGGVTNTRYRFGIGKEFGWVDVRDAGEKGKRGFLSLKDTQGNWLFEQEQPDSGTPAVATRASNPSTRVRVLVQDAPRTVESQVDVVEVVDEPVVETVQAFPTPSEYNAKEIMAMDLTTSQWRGLYEAEIAHEKPRKSLLTWLEEKLAGV